MILNYGRNPAVENQAVDRIVRGLLFIQDILLILSLAPVGPD